MMNLHDLARLITVAHPDESITLYQSTGQNNDHGLITPEYAEPQTVKAQIQSASSEDLAQVQNVSQNAITMKFWLYAEGNLAPAGIKRPFARTGDMIQRSDGTYWLINAVPEDYTGSEWVSVLATLQEDAP